MAITFEDPDIQRCVVDLQRTPAFRRLKTHMETEATAPGGKPETLASAVMAALTEGLLEGVPAQQPQE